jgi:hypothetical protein
VSRVDDDRDAARVAERVAIQKRAEETKRKEGQAADSQFARLVQGQKTEAQKGQKQATEAKGVAKSAIARLLEKRKTTSPRRPATRWKTSPPATPTCSARPRRGCAAASPAK